MIKFTKNIFSITSEFIYKARYSLALRIINLLKIDTEKLIETSKNNGNLLKYFEDSEFIVGHTGDNEIDEYFSNVFNKYPIKGQFLIRLEDCFLLTDWSIPVTTKGEIIIEPSGTLGMLTQNICFRSSKSKIIRST